MVSVKQALAELDESETALVLAESTLHAAVRRVIRATQAVHSLVDLQAFDGNGGDPTTSKTSWKKQRPPASGGG